MSDEDTDENTIDDIISQLKNQGKSLNKLSNNIPNIEKDEIEKFIIDNASQVVTDCVEMISDIKNEIDITDPNPRVIESAAQLVQAFTAALDTLTKLKLSDDKLKSQKELKKLDIAGKMELNAGKEKEKTEGIFLSREEVIKGLLSYKEKEVVEEKKVEDPPIDV